MKDFYIKKVSILNFRGYSGAKEYNFVDKDGNPYNIILLSGPNGYGKTTLLDSIEWCLTGNIKRVIDDYNNRCTSKVEKTVSSYKGLIRNINSTNKEVIVKIEMVYKNEDVKVYRKFNSKNELEAFDTLLTEFNIECSDNIRDEVEEIIKGMKTDFTFNNICSYDRNIELYKKGRNDIYNFFDACYSEFYEAKKIIENLEKLKKNLSDSKDSKSENFNRLKRELNLKEELLKTFNSIDNIKIRKYPENKLFNGEIYIDDSIINNKVDIDEKLNNQLEILTNILNKKISDNLKKVKEKELLTVKVDEIDELAKIYKDKEEVFNKIKNIDFNIINVELKEVELFKRNINKSIDKFLEYISNIINNTNSELNHIPKSKILTIETNLKLINKNLDFISVLEKEKKKYDSNSDLVKVMRYLVDNEQVYKLYSEDNNKCPLCGKEGFSKSEISSVAKDFLGEKDKARQQLIENIKSCNNEIKIYVDDIKEIIENSLTEKEKELLGLIEYKKSLDDLYKLANKYKLDINELDLNRISDKKVEIQKEIYILKIEKINEEYIIELLKNSKMPYIIKYNKELEEYREYDSKSKVKLLDSIIFQLDKNISILDNKVINDEYKKIKIETIKDKLDITKDYISYIKSNNLNIEINKLNNEIKYCENEIESLSNKLKKVSELKKVINKEKTESEKKENERISKPLNDIYKKITRNTNIKEINLKKDNAKNKSSLEIKDIEGNDTPFGNIMSTGQVSTLAISMYLAKALLNRNSSFKVYLMDDPIQTMDDLNILSLIDLLRFQFMENEEDRIMNQLFISTCDEDLENLIYHKMSSFNIPIINENFMKRMLS